MNFAQSFTDLTGHAPFPWQVNLYDRFIADPLGSIPTACSIPTGLGKTSVLPIWLLAWRARPAQTPRRLVYVVNRRTVVDQTTDEAERLRQRAIDRGWGEGLVPTISTLRGQHADNRAWSSDPSRPAIICGTVDMIGSRLLFRGYGVGWKSRPLHAGFLGHDVLLVHDEAHLEPAFQTLIDQIVREQEREAGAAFGIPRLRIMELSATSRGAETAFALGTADEADPEVQRRLHATKAIRLHPLRDAKKLAEQLTELALTHREAGRSVLIFARTVEDVMRVSDQLRKSKQQVVTLTGTLRGKERDDLVNHPIFRRFLPAAISQDGETVYLVCTSAGEVGVNLSADHLVSDLTTFESMAQRFGRVNRFGLRHDTCLDVIHPTSFADDEVEQARQRTLTLLEQLAGDGSPWALGQLDLAARSAAFAPAPKILPTSEILFDAWSLTSVREPLPGRPPVEPYLHGLADWQPPETQIAWRTEVETITGPLLDRYPCRELLDAYPLRPRELLRDRTDRIEKQIKRWKVDGDLPAWIVQPNDMIDVVTLKEIQAGDVDLRHCTLLLPPSVGGLREGLFDPSSLVAEDAADDESRQRLWGEVAPPVGMRRCRPVIDLLPDDDGDDASSDRHWHWFERIDHAGEGLETSNRMVALTDHLHSTKKAMEGIVDRLELAEPLRTALIVAAALHDLGKNRRLWQRSIGNFDEQSVLAKSGGALNWRQLSGYRHEFGSLIDLRQHDEFLRLDADMQDLLLHVVAAHHGRGRPHFPSEEAFDPNVSDSIAEELKVAIPLRFARLQRRYGRWGLAYLESLLRAADISASKFSEDAP